MKGLYYNGTAAEYREDLPMPVPVRHSAESWDMNL